MSFALPGWKHVRTLRATGIAVVLLAVFLAYRLFFAAPDGPSPELLVLAGKTADTTWEVRIAGEDLDERLRERARALIETRLAEVDLWFSSKRPDSEVARFNANRTTDPFDVSSPTAELVAYAIELCKWSGSAFDITVGPLVARWRVAGDGKRADPPSQAEIDAYLDHTGAEIIHVGRGNPKSGGFLHKFEPEVGIDLGPVTSGYAADHIAGGLFDLGRLDFFVEVGGKIYAAGHRPDGKPWRVAIDEPIATDPQVHAILELSDQGFATATAYPGGGGEAGGDGERRARLIDPRTGRPIENGMASATVIAPTATQAAAFSTTLMVMGAKDGLALAEQWNLGAMTLARAAAGSLHEERNALYPKPLDPVPDPSDAPPLAAAPPVADRIPNP